MSRLDALAKATEYRQEKARIRRELKTGRLSLGDLLADLPPCCSKTPAFDALQWLPKIGPATAHKVADGFISETLPIRCLGAQTRQELIQRVLDATGGSP